MKIPNVDKKTRIAIATILAIGAVLLAIILLSGKKPDASGGAEGAEHTEASEHGDSEHHGDAPKKGPHGGRLFTQGSLSVEALLAEQDGEARHQLWAYENGKPLPPSSFTATEQIKRPQGEVQDYAFVVKGGSLVTTKAIAEPHVFDAAFVVNRGKQVVQFKIESEEGKVEMSDAQAKAAGIKIETAAPARIRSAFQLAGEIRFNEDRTAHVVPRLAGVVESVAANLGQQVKKGQILAVIASTAVSEMRSELLSAQKKQALAQVTYEREKKLWQDKITAEQDFLQAQQAFRESEIATQNARQKLAAIGASTGTVGALSRYELRAPFDGAIVEKHIALGEAVKEDSNVFMISDLSSVWAEIIVPAKDLGIVRVGERATVKATSMGAVSTGTVSYVGSLLGEQTRTATARVTLANPSLAWRPGLFVNVELTSDERNAPVAVLSDAIQTVNDSPTVFVKMDGGFVGQVVTTGRSDGKYTEILTGIKPGTAYAASGSFVVKAEQGKGSAEHAH
ncbi:MAG: efflux RND transporter periplasmic adaptor subunit [Telluria sp.]|nr:efflux RND transporter periplasmic adaptor subunit [Telluria sp.]